MEMRWTPVSESFDAAGHLAYEPSQTEEWRVGRVGTNEIDAELDQENVRS
jgi:hypothetical protein